MSNITNSIEILSMQIQFQYGRFAVNNDYKHIMVYVSMWVVEKITKLEPLCYAYYNSVTEDTESLLSKREGRAVLVLTVTRSCCLYYHLAPFCLVYWIMFLCSWLIQILTPNYAYGRYPCYYKDQNYFESTPLICNYIRSAKRKAHLAGLDFQDII